MTREEAIKYVKTYLLDEKNNIEALTTLVPELEENEDEKIRKELIKLLRNLFNNYSYFIKDPFYTKCINWLEKQKTLANYDEAEKEKHDFVSGQYIECRKSFDKFKEDNSYWFEYIGDDNYIGRSDNILNQKFHITPRQLFTLFTQQHCPKEDSNVNDETNAPTEYGKYVEECLNEAAKHFFSEGEDKYSVADLFYAGIRCGKSWCEKQCASNTHTNLPKFTFDDVLALQCCMETVKKVQEDKPLHEKLQSLHSRVYDAYHLEEQGEQKSSNVEDYNNIDPHFGKPIVKTGDVYRQAEQGMKENNGKTMVATIDRAEKMAKAAFMFEPDNNDTQNKFKAFIQGYRQAEKDVKESQRN